MSGKKLTDNEIIKALECCPRGIGMKCEKCPMFRTNDCMSKLHVNTLDLINRQQVKIERLQKTEIEIDDFCRRICRMRMLNGNAIASYEDLQSYIQEEKAKAYKEFAEGLKNSIKKSVDDAWHSDGNGIYDAECVLDDIDNLVKEMVGENND